MVPPIYYNIITKIYIPDKVFLARQIDMIVYYAATAAIMCAAFAALTPVWAKYTKLSSQ